MQWSVINDLIYVKIITNSNSSIIPDAVVVELVIAGESYKSSPAKRQWEEHLDRCISPHLNDKSIIDK